MRINEMKELINICKNGELADVANWINDKNEDSFTEEELVAIKNKSSDSTGEDSSSSYELVGKDKFKVSEIKKMTKAEKQSVVKVPSREEARYISDIYYQIQTMRIGVEGQLRAMSQNADQDSNEIANKAISNVSSSKPFLEWYKDNLKSMENEIGKALAVFSDSCYMGKWAKANLGIGPTIATQLVAYLDIPRDTGFYAGNWWSYCGLNDNNRPWLGREKSVKLVNKYCGGDEITDEDVMKLSAASKWKYSYYEKNARSEATGKWSKSALVKATAKIPYNAHMKVLMYKIGHQFVFVQNNPNSLYGRIFKERLAYEVAKNERGEYKEQAFKIINDKNFNKNTTAYKEYSKGKLPAAHLKTRAQRYATKMFISHLFEAEYWNKYGKEAPNPYEMAVAGHKGYVGPEVPYTTFERDGI